MKPKIGKRRPLYFDATFLHFAHDLRGIPQVILQLIRFLESENDAPNSLLPAIIYLITEQGYRRFLEPLGIPQNRIESVRPWPLIGRFERFHGIGTSWRYRKLKTCALGIIHPEPRTLVRFNIPQWVLFYDFISIENEFATEKIAFSRQLYFKAKMQLAKRATSIATISEYTANRLVQLFPSIDPQIIKTLPLGMRANMQIESNVKKNISVPLSFLYVGSFDKRKNIAALIENLPIISSNLPAVLHLVGWISPEKKDFLGELAKRLPPDLTVVFHGLVPDGELKTFYLNAHFLLFPSHFEGFGLPLIEAMSYGVPVCAFNNSAIPEVLGDSALIAENDDFEAWGTAISKACESSTVYSRWSEGEYVRSQYFTEDKMKDRYLKHIYDFVNKAEALV